MSRVLALVEGRTEQTFVQRVLAPELGQQGVYLSATLIGKPGHKGGIRRYPAVRNDILAALRQDPEQYCTTMVDYSGLPRDWPGLVDAKATRVGDIGSRLEQAFLADVVLEMGSSFNPARFVPYIQMHEFEALLFSDPAVLASTIQRPDLRNHFDSIVTECGAPEAIDDGQQTSPSKRILGRAANYDKVLHGTMASMRIGINTMREQCPHFAAWIARLENLGRVT